MCLHACLFLFCFYLFLSRISMFTTFEWVLCLPSGAYGPVYYEFMRRLHVVFYFSSPVHRLHVHRFHVRSGSRYSINGCLSDYACVHWGYLLWDSMLVLLTSFVYRIRRTLRETLVLFTWSCLSPCPSKGFACFEMLLLTLSLFLLSLWIYGDLFLPE
jgi:hypothetical protein